MLELESPVLIDYQFTLLYFLLGLSCKFGNETDKIFIYYFWAAIKYP